MRGIEDNTKDRGQEGYKKSVKHPSKKRNTILPEECPPFLSIANVSSNNLELNSVISEYIYRYNSSICSLADEEFDELCFQFGIELDEVVTFTIILIHSL